MGKSIKAAPVLDRDTELSFPHALIISASAGSGKTYTLTQRYVQFLLSEKVPGNALSGLLAVTFTNNAAKEMKARVLSWLKELALNKNSVKMEETLQLVSLGRDELQSRARELVERIIANYSDFHIQTIDSFLTRVMRASVDELKLPLKAEITMTYDNLIDLALYSIFSKIGKAALPAEAVDRFLAVLPKTGAYPWNPAQRVKENFNSFLTQEGKTVGEIKISAQDYEAAVKDKFIAALKFCASLVEHYGRREFFKGKALAALEAKNLTSFLASYKYDYGIFNGGKKRGFPPGWEGDRDNLNEMVTELLELNALAYYQSYVGIYQKFKEELERVKCGKTDVVHINDIAKKLSTYISQANVPEIYLKLGERISHFLIDEFQDTNRLQWEALRPLMEEAISKAGSLFVVGDVKQAIYMFRNADYKIMRSFLDIAEGSAPRSAYMSLEPLDGRLKRVNLPVNYRSDGEILNYVDRIFKQKLKSVPALAGEDPTGLTSYTQSGRPERLKEGYVKTDTLELEDLGATGQQREWLLKAVRSARQRYPLNEIAILVAKNKRIEEVVEWLTEAAIPVASLSSLDIRKRKVIAELLAFLKFLESPADDLAFTEFISGDIFACLTGLKRAEIMAFVLEARGSNPGGILYSEFRKHSGHGKYWDDYLDEPFRKVGYLPLYELVALIYRKFRLFENFQDEQAFLARFLEAVAVLEAKGVTSLRAFVECACAQDADKAAVFSIALPEYIDAVRVMTFHKSKGLGFSVVINMLYDERDQNAPMYFAEKDGDIKVYHITKAAAEESAKLGPVYEGRKAEENIQDLNTLYVISTRARHELYNLIIRKARKNASSEPGVLDLFAAYEAGKPANRGFQPPRACEPVVIAAAGEPVDQQFEARKPTYAGFFEAAEGELVHKILSRINFLSGAAGRERGGVKADLKKYYAQYAPAYPFSFDEDKIISVLYSFLVNPAVAELYRAQPDRQALIEAEFITQDGGLFRMDRVIVDPGLVTVVDFKTGRQNSRKYNAQLKNYLAIISAVYARPARGLLAYVDLGEVVEAGGIC